MLKDTLRNLSPALIRARLRRTHVHTLYAQLVEEVKTMRKSADDIPFFAGVLEDLQNPAINKNPELRMFYAGVITVLNIIKAEEDGVARKDDGDGAGAGLVAEKEENAKGTP